MCGSHTTVLWIEDFFIELLFGYLLNQLHTVYRAHQQNLVNHCLMKSSQYLLFLNFHRQIQKKNKYSHHNNHRNHIKSPLKCIIPNQTLVPQHLYSLHFCTSRPSLLVLTIYSPSLHICIFDSYVVLTTFVKIEGSLSLSWLLFQFLLLRFLV